MRRLSLQLSDLRSSGRQVSAYFLLEHKAYKGQDSCGTALHLHPRHWSVSGRLLSTTTVIPLGPFVVPPGAISLTLRALGEDGVEEDGFRSTAFHELSVPGVVTNQELLLLQFDIPRWDRFIARIEIDTGLFPYPARTVELTTRIP